MRLSEFRKLIREEIRKELQIQRRNGQMQEGLFDMFKKKSKFSTDSDKGFRFTIFGADDVELDEYDKDKFNYLQGARMNAFALGEKKKGTEYGRGSYVIVTNLDTREESEKYSAIVN